MKEQLKALYALQQVDSKLESIKKELAALDSGATLKQQIITAQAHEKKLESDLQKTEADLKDAELSLKTIEQKRASLEKRLYGGSVSNPKELSSIEKEIEMFDRSRAQQDEKILALYEQVEQKKTAYTDLHNRVVAALQRLQKITQKFAVESKRLATEKTQLEAERAEAAKGIDVPLLRRYDTIRSRAGSGGVGIVRIADGKCGGCHVGLTNYLLTSVKESETPVQCENCGRFLFTGNE